jgi:hypothetical protein
MSEWLRPILGAALLLAGAAGLAYKVISGYQHPSPDAFISVHDQNRLPAVSAVDHPTPAATVPVDGAAPALTAASATPSAAGAAPSAAGAAPSAASAAQTPASAAPSAASAAQTPPIAAAPPAASGDTSAAAIASRAARNVALSAEAQDNPACVSIQTEQREIQGALKKQYSPEQGRFMQRRLRELADQSVKFKCAE